MRFCLSCLSTLALAFVVGCADDATHSQPKPNIGQSTTDEVLRVQQDTPMSFEFNREYERRDFILGIEVDWNVETSGGIKQFDLLEVAMLEKLFNERFIDPSDTQNESPLMQHFYDFMKRNPNVLAYGYAVSPKRDDYRVTIVGLRVPADDVTPQLKKGFIDFCKGADELMTDRELLSWWD
jgi:hypothetical protein